LNKVHAPKCPAGFNISDYAPKVRRAVADAGRWAASVRRCYCHKSASLLWQWMPMTRTSLDARTSDR
jgi:hypothetical protein